MPQVQKDSTIWSANFEGCNLQRLGVRLIHHQLIRKPACTLLGGIPPLLEIFPKFELVTFPLGALH